MNRRDILLSIFFTVVLCLAAVPAVSAFTVSKESPTDGLHNGDRIVINVNNAAVGNQITYRLYSTNLDTSTTTVAYTNMYVPFNFTVGSSATQLSSTGTYGPSTLTVKRLSDSTELTLTGNPITSSKNVKAGYYDVTMSGSKAGTGVIGIDYSVSGTIDNYVTNPSPLSFTIQGINSGTLTVEVSQGASVIFTQDYTITPASQTGGGGNTGGGTDGGSTGNEGAGAAAGPAAAGPAAQLAPTGVSGTTATIQHNELNQTLADYVIETDPAAGFSSAVSITSGTGITSNGTPVNEITVTPLDPSVVTTLAASQAGVYSFSGLSVACEPSGAKFTGGSATISFTLTDAQWADALVQVNGNTTAMSIQYYDTSKGSWVTVPTTVNAQTHTVTAQITHFSMYALFYKGVKETTTPASQTIGDLVNKGATPAVTTASTTVVNTQMAPLVTQEQQGGVFDGFFSWFNNLFGAK